MNTYGVIRLTDFGVALNGEHFYADVSVYVADDNMGDKQVKHAMSTEFAERLNKKDGTDIYEEGMLTPRFEGRDNAINRSIEIIKENWPFIHTIFVGMPGSPVQCVACSNAESMNRANRIYAAFEQCYKDTNDPWTAGLGHIIDGLYRQWDNEMEKMGVD